MTTEQTKVYAYMRYSSEKQRNGESIATQREAIEAYAERNNYRIAEYFIDEARTGRDTNRKGLNDLIDKTAKNKDKIKYVVVYKMNRISRDMPSYFANVYTVLRSRNIKIKSATEDFDDTSLGTFVQNTLVNFGQLENDMRRDVTVDTMQHVAKNGYWQNAPMVGYEMTKISTPQGKKRPSLVMSNKAPLVRDVLERFSQGDITLTQLTKYADAIGLRSRNGNVLKPQAVRNLIDNPIYAGYVTGKLTGGGLVEGVHEPIISKEVYAVNQSLLHGKKTRAGEKRRLVHPDYPLKGLLRCPSCKMALYASAPRTGAGGRSPRYLCSRKTCLKRVKSIKSEVMHEKFVEMLRDVKPDPRILKLYKEVLMVESSNRLGKLSAKIDRLNAEIDAISQKRMNAIRKYVEDRLTAREKDEIVAEYDADREALEESLDSLRNQQRIQESDIELALDIMARVDVQWLDAPVEIKIRFQSMLFPEGLVYDSKSGNFGTNKMSRFYRLVANKKDSEESSKSILVAGVGFEPTTFGL